MAFRTNSNEMVQLPSGLWVSPAAQVHVDHPSAIRGPWPLTIEGARGAPVPFLVDRCDVGCLNRPPIKRIRRYMIEKLRNDIRLDTPAKYTVPASGVLALREEMAAWVNRLCGFANHFTAKQVIITNAGLGGVELAIEQFSHEWVARVKPGWGNTSKAIFRARRREIEVDCPTGHLPSAAELAEMLPDTPGLMIIDDPNNPLGESSTQEDLDVLEELLKLKPNLTVGVDHEYMGLNSGEFFSPAMLKHPRVVFWTSFSKVTGGGKWRLGAFMWDPSAGLDAHMHGVADYKLSQNNTGGLQTAIAEAMADTSATGLEAEYRRIVGDVDGKRMVVVDVFQDCDVAVVHKGNSAFYTTVGPNGGPQWLAGNIRLWGIQERYEGRVDRPFTDCVPAFGMKHRTRITLAPVEMRRAATNLRLDIEDYVAAGMPDVPSVPEMLERYSPEAMVERGQLVRLPASEGGGYRIAA